MSTANRSARKAAAITSTANKARTTADKSAGRVTRPALGRSAGSDGKEPVYGISRPGIRTDQPVKSTTAKRIARPSLGRRIGGKGPIYEVPKPVRIKHVKK